MMFELELVKKSKSLSLAWHINSNLLKLKMIIHDIRAKIIMFYLYSSYCLINSIQINIIMFIL